MKSFKKRNQMFIQVYLRPNGSHPPCCPMPCPPKAIVTTFPGRTEEAQPPAPKKCLVCTVKRIPVLPPPPPTPPVNSPCRPHIGEFINFSNRQFHEFSFYFCPKKKHKNPNKKKDFQNREKDENSAAFFLF